MSNNIETLLRRNYATALDQQHEAMASGDVDKAMKFLELLGQLETKMKEHGISINDDKNSSTNVGGGITGVAGNNNNVDNHTEHHNTTNVNNNHRTTNNNSTTNIVTWASRRKERAADDSFIRLLLPAVYPTISASSIYYIFRHLDCVTHEFWDLTKKDLSEMLPETTGKQEIIDKILKAKEHLIEEKWNGLMSVVIEAEDVNSLTFRKGDAYGAMGGGGGALRNAKQFATLEFVKEIADIRPKLAATAEIYLLILWNFALNQDITGPYAKTWGAQLVPTFEACGEVAASDTDAAQNYVFALHIYVGHCLTNYATPQMRQNLIKMQGAANRQSEKMRNAGITFNTPGSSAYNVRNKIFYDLFEKKR